MCSLTLVYVLTCVALNGLFPSKFCDNNHMCGLMLVCTTMCFLNGLFPSKFCDNNDMCGLMLVCTTMCFLKWFISKQVL